MKTSPQPRITSQFPLPELQAIGDAICQMLRLGSEEELLGDAILAKVRTLLARKQVTSEDVVRLALISDALRIAEEAILADGAISEVEVGYALALFRDAAQRLSSFRAYYAHHADVDAEGVRSFVIEHHADTQMFGGACTETRWLGLDIVRRVVQETRDRDVLDKYAELMVRLSEEIVALEQTRQPAELIRKQLEERLGLRQLLVEAESCAPEVGEDPRLRAFCSAEAPDVFHAVEHANQIWTPDPFDVDSVHAAPRAVFSRLLQRAAQQKSSGTGRVLLVLGESGSGKTHLMRVFRNQVHGERQGYVGYMQLAGAPPDYARYVLANLIDSLEKPYDAPEVSESGLMSLSDTLLLSPQSITPEQRLTLQESELSDSTLCDLVFKLADEVISESRFAHIDLDLIRAFLFLQRREPRLHGRVIKFLRGQPLNPYDTALIGGLVPRTDDALALIVALGKLIACVDGGSLVLLLDQLEDIYNQQSAKDQFVRLMDVVRQVSDTVPNALVVVSCLTNFYPELRKTLTRSVLDRIEHDPEPQRLLENRSLAEIEAMVERRLAWLYENQGVRHRTDEPHFPIPRTFLESQAELRVRDVLSHLQRYQHKCIAAGRVVEETLASSLKPPAPPPPPDDFTKAWVALADAPSTGAPTQDEQLLELLVWSLRAVATELPAGVEMPVEQRGETVQVTAPNRGDRVSQPLQISLVNEPKSKLAKQIEGACKAAKQNTRFPVVVRCSEFGGGPGTKIAVQLAAIRQAGGQKVVFEQASWDKLVAFRKFHEQNANKPGWQTWLRAERPLLSLNALRGVLGFPASSADVRDNFVPVYASTSKVPLSKSLREPDAKSIKPTHPANTNAPPTDPKRIRIGTVMSVKQDLATIELEQLKRHCAFLGASGSGKTSLALNVIEQAAERGIGVVMLDRKGDLTTFADSQCWERSDPDPRRIERKQRLHEKLDVRLFTPGNPNGLALGIRAVPSGLADLPPQERSHLARFAAQGLGSMMGYNNRQSDQAHVAILAKAIEVVGQLGPNKELGLRELIDLLADEDPSLIAELGHIDLRLCKKVVTNLEVLRINHGALLESQVPPLSAESLLGFERARASNKVPLTIISTKFLGGPQRVDFWVSQMLVELSRWCSRSPAGNLQSLLFLDEADLYMPATSKPATKEPLQDLLKRARSGGLGVMLATQSPGDLDYKARDTIGTWWIGRIGTPTAIEKMKPLLSECRTDVSASLATSSVGEFFQICDGHVTRVRSDRSLMDTTQLTEDRILELARSQRARGQAVA